MKIEIYNGTISEFDMMAAGPMCALTLNIISEEMANIILESDKQARSILFGQFIKQLRDETGIDYFHIINEEIAKWVNEFIKVNNIKPENILEIAKDAIFLKMSNVKIKTLNLDDFIIFRNKNTYSYMLAFSADENSNVMIKIYKKGDHLVIRGSSFNESHAAIDELYQLIYFMINKDEKMWNKAFSEFKRILKEYDDSVENRLIKHISNSYLINVLLEASTN